MFTACLLFLAVLLLTTVGTVDCHRARNQGVPVRAVFDDVMKLGNLFKIMFDRNRAVLVSVDKHRFPALVTMQRHHVTHAEYLLRSSNKSGWIAVGQKVAEPTRHAAGWIGMKSRPLTTSNPGYIMSILQSTKKAVERVTGVARPGKQGVTDLVRRRKANEFWFKDDGLVPNHPFWPLVIYRSAVRLPEEFDPAAVLEELFEANGWGDSWRNAIYDYVHYHSRIHEVLGVAAGTAKVRFGGKKGRTLSLKAGDVAVLPAGTGHQCLSASDDFLVVGAYPPFGTYDECTTAQEHDGALATIRKVGRPRKDPVYGSKGPLLQNWKKT